jgi:hypothetical protein
MDFLVLEAGTDKLPRYIGYSSTSLRPAISQNNEGHKHAAKEAKYLANILVPTCAVREHQRFIRYYFSQK